MTDEELKIKINEHLENIDSEILIFIYSFLEKYKKK